MTSEFGLELMSIPGSMLNIFYRGRLVKDVRAELFPVLLPMSLRGRVSLARAGLRLRRDAKRYMKLLAPRPGDTDAAIRLRALQHGGDETFAQFLGPLDPEAFEIFQALANRSLAEPDEISQSAMAGLFGHVWDTGDLGRNLRGGAGLLPEAVGASLGDGIRVNARVTELALEDGTVRVRYRTAGGDDEVVARAAIVAIPAPLIGDIMPTIPADTLDALACVRFGSLAVLSLHTNEVEVMPWDSLYSILTPDKSFNMFFNHANALQTRTGEKQGSVLMVYAGGNRYRSLASLSDEEVVSRFVKDLCAIFPEIEAIISETMFKRWSLAGPFAAPGRWRVQEKLERGLAGRLFFAGDWMSEFVSMESAARTGIDAAAQVREALA